jgi:DNA-binding transcriptional MocR family regulator
VKYITLCDLQPLETTILPTGCKPEVISMDEGGITPEGVEAAVQRSIASTGRAPKLMYIVPHCQNPTGSTLSMQRKRDIYAICQHHNIVILEDDPYVFLQFSNDCGTFPGMLSFSCVNSSLVRPHTHRHNP